MDQQGVRAWLAARGPGFWLPVSIGGLLLVAAISPSREDGLAPERSDYAGPMGGDAADQPAAPVERRETEGAVSGFARQIEQHLDRCALARELIVASTNLGPAATYDSARRADEICRTEWLALADRDVPGGIDGDDVQVCKTALHTYAEAAERAALFVDDGGNAARYEMQQELDAALGMEVECRLSLGLSDTPGDSLAPAGSE